MVASNRWALLLALSASFAVIGCGDDDSDDGGGGSVPPKTVELGGAFLDAKTRAPVEGFEICTLKPTGRDPGCATTGADGRIVAPGFPVNSEVLFTGKKDGLYPILISGVTTESDQTDFVMFTMAASDVAALLAASNLTAEAGKGAILVFAGDGTAAGLTDVTAGGLPGVSFTASPAATPVYLKGALLDAAATETDASGWAVFLNLEPDVQYTVTTSHASRACSVETGWPGSADGEGRVPTMADTLSYVTISCQ